MRSASRFGPRSRREPATAARVRSAGIGTVSGDRHRVRPVGESARPTSGSLRTHSVGGPEITARVGDECTIGGMVDGLNRRDPLDEPGIVAVDVLDQFGLGICRTGDQDCAGGTDCSDHVLKEGVIFGGVPAAERVRFVMNVSSGMLGMHDDLVNISRVEMKHPRFMVIDPDGSVIVVRQDFLRNGNFQGKESKLPRPTVRTKYALRNAYIGSIVDECTAIGSLALRLGCGDRTQVPRVGEFAQHPMHELD
jgi:hypothetical protein